MTLYHGSNMLVEHIDLSRSSRYKDFGQAFYLSAEESQANEMAEGRADFLGGQPTINPFLFDENLMQSSQLNVKIFPHYSLEWAEFVWNNRDNQQDYHHPYDIVYGPIMNDTIGQQMRDYRLAHKDLRLFLKGIKYFKGETYQYAFCTPLAISHLKRLPV